MITELIQKLKSSTDKTEMISISEEIIAAAQNLTYPDDEFKKNTLGNAKQTLEEYISEYDSEFQREYNSRNLDAMILLNFL
jgi:predicted metal-dependent hydrolase